MRKSNIHLGVSDETIKGVKTQLLRKSVVRISASECNYGKHRAAEEPDKTRENIMTTCKETANNLP